MGMVMISLLLKRGCGPLLTVPKCFVFRVGSKDWQKASTLQNNSSRLILGISLNGV